MMLASCREESGPIPPGVYIEGIDGDPYGDLDVKVPVYYQGDADLGSYEFLGTVSQLSAKQIPADRRISRVRRQGHGRFGDCVAASLRSAATA